MRLFRDCLFRCMLGPSISRSLHSSIRKKDGFGIVAAMTRNQVIGVNGSLPWTNLAQDRNHFVNLTRNRVLLVGRRTFALEDASLAHIHHCRVCIVVSTSMKEDDLIAMRSNESERPMPKLLLTGSFDDALKLARLENHRMTHDDDERTIYDNRDDEMIDCWVAGGERIYKEALRHPYAKEVHLTHVDMFVDTSQCHDVALFPLEEMYANNFEQISTRRDGKCKFNIYRGGRKI